MSPAVWTLSPEERNKSDYHLGMTSVKNRAEVVNSN
jgi:hypothetical protein